jgi:hypothetical protein
LYIVGPVVTCALQNKEIPGSFEGRIVRWIFGAVQRDGKWRRGYKCDTCELCGEMDLVKQDRIDRLHLAGQLTGMYGDQITERIVMYCKRHNIIDSVVTRLHVSTVKWSSSGLSRNYLNKLHE